MSFDNVHGVLAVINGDPGLPFITFIDMSGVVARNPADTLQRQHCLPIDQTLAYGPYPPGYNPATYPLQGSVPVSLHQYNWILATGVRSIPLAAFLGKSTTTAPGARRREELDSLTPLRSTMWE